MKKDLTQDELKKKPHKKKIHLQQRDKTIKEIRKYEDFDEGLKNWKIQNWFKTQTINKKLNL